MRRWTLLLFFIVVSLSVLSAPIDGISAVRTSIGLVGGAGHSTGWWADRFGFSEAGEINIRYEFAPGTGILMLAGLSKAQLVEMSKQDVAAEARVHNLGEFDDRRTILTASQGGSFKHIPLGFGLYRESQIGAFRPYGSAAMSVFLWQFDRSQTFYEEVESLGDPIPHTDNWKDDQDGATLGAQFAFGTLYQIRRMMFIDMSLAFHWLNIGTKNGALAYWGYPVRSWNEDRINEGKGSVNYLQFRIGLRYGR